MTKPSILFVIAVALASTGMSCTQQTPSTPSVDPLTVEDTDTSTPATAVETEREPVDPPPPARPLPAGTEDTGTFNVRLKTTKGDVVIEVHPAWAPLGAVRFRELVEAGFYDDCALFRVVEGFVVQFGINGDPAVHAQWKDRTIRDDPVLQSNQRGYVVFAKTGLPDSRSTQIFINYGNNAQLDGMAFAPFGVVVEGLENAFAFNREYGGAPSNRQPDIVNAGNEFLKANYPNLDYIVKATIEETALSADPLPAIAPEPAGVDSAAAAEPDSGE